MAAWGKNNPFFLRGGAEAFNHDIPAEVRFFDAGHFALETHREEISALVYNSLSRYRRDPQGAALQTPRGFVSFVEFRSKFINIDEVVCLSAVARWSPIPRYGTRHHNREIAPVREQKQAVPLVSRRRGVIRITL